MINIEHPAYYSKQIEQQEQQQFNYKKKEVQTLINRAKKFKDAADTLYKYENFTMAGLNYIESCERYQKAALSASNIDDEVKYINSKKKEKEVRMTHSQQVLSETLSSEDINIVSKERAKELDKIHGGIGLSYIAIKFEEIELTKESCTKLKDTAYEASENYNKLVQDEKDRVHKNEILEMVENAMKSF